MTSTPPEIRDDLGIPAEKRGGPRGPSKWGLLKELEVGQSAVWRFDTREEMERFRNTLSSTCHRYGSNLGRVFTVRTMKPDESGLMRVGVWRKE